MKHPAELLMPAGSFEKMQFAFRYGADAVYAGVPLFSLRARENDFRREALHSAIDYAHGLGKKIYLTMNIYAHNSKVDRFLDCFEEFAQHKPDGFIMTDIGLINLAKQRCPNAVIHLSTQANATNWATVAFWRDLGVKRVILSRELSISEITEIHSRVPDIELEAFVHGSICIAYSGRCLISNYLTHRDANQGTCTNSCRWQYSLARENGSLLQNETQSDLSEQKYRPVDGKYFISETQPASKRAADAKYELDEDEHGTYMMNSKDLCAIELLGELHQAGVCSFKAEGRTKSIYYMAAVTRAYRRAIDDMLAGRPFSKDNLFEVMTAASRTLMTGFLKKRPNEYGENYEDGGSKPLTHRFAGQVLEFDEARGLATISVKNRLSKGSLVEWVTPEGIIPMRLETIINHRGVSVSEASGGVTAAINCPFPADEFCLLRVPLTGAERLGLLQQDTAHAQL